MTEPARLTWPGIDQQRAVAACWHLIRAVQIGQLAADPVRARTVWRRRRALELAADNARLARGYLGAVGFELRGRR